MVVDFLALVEDLLGQKHDNQGIQGWERGSLSFEIRRWGSRRVQKVHSAWAADMRKSLVRSRIVAVDSCAVGIVQVVVRRRVQKRRLEGSRTSKRDLVQNFACLVLLGLGKQVAWAPTRD